jgi:excisionase family DNA binding protein
MVAKLEVFNMLDEAEGRQVERLADVAAEIVNGPVQASTVEPQLMGMVHTLLAFRVIELRRFMAEVTALEPAVIRRGKRRKRPVAEPIRIKPGDGVVETVEARGTAWSVPELAEVIGISEGAVYAAVREGRLSKLKSVGTTVRICPKAAGQWPRDP